MSIIPGFTADYESIAKGFIEILKEMGREQRLRDDYAGLKCEAWLRCLQLGMVDVSMLAYITRQLCESIERKAGAAPTAKQKMEIRNKLSIALIVAGEDHQSFADNVDVLAEVTP